MRSSFMLAATSKRACSRLAFALSLISATAFASAYRGQVTFGGLPVPGATVTATQAGKKVVATTDSSGGYSFTDLSEGTWTIEVQLLLFETAKQDVTITAAALDGKWELKLLPLASILAQSTAQPSEQETALLKRPGPPPGRDKAANESGASTARVPEVKPPAQSASSSDGFLINGSISNAATSPFSMASAFGNTRSSRSLYTGGIGIQIGNSAFDAKPYSLTGLDTPKPAYSRITALVTFGGPLNIPHLMPHGPNLFLVYQATRDRNNTTLSGLVPTLDQRNGILDTQVLPVSTQSAALLNLYPLPNLVGSTAYNYQTAALSNNHQDSLILKLDRSIGRRDSLDGSFALDDSRADTANLFRFVDTTDTLGLNTKIDWTHRYKQNLYGSGEFRFSRLSTHVTPQFANRVNVSGDSRISGNLQDASNWGPPNLTFTSISSLSDANSSFNRNMTNALSYALTWSRSRHNVTAGGEFRRQEFNVLSQENPRGTFAFTGAATGTDLGDFLVGTPDTSQIAFGNADKYLRQSVYAAYITDDWRVRPELTLNVGIRWDYGAPITELKNRLVNLDVAGRFSQIAPVLASSPKGPLTGQGFPTSLIQPDKHGFQPRFGASWRPIPGSTLVVRGGYGIYVDTSIYEATALAMAQQSPLSTSLSVDRSATCPLDFTNGSGFLQCSGVTANTFGVDPHLKVGYAQTWQVSAQRDLPGAVVATATYLGVKGTHGIQEFLPNTYPIGSPLAAAGLSGYIYRTSGGNSSRQSGQIQVRRRLRSGLTASLQYTYSKSIDNDSALGGQGPVASGVSSDSLTTTSSPTATIAQDWLNLRGERGLSIFDQRHLLKAQIQYTSGQGVGGGTLMSGWRGRLLKQWTIVNQITAGSGLPETPIYLAAVPGTGFTGSIRPDRTGTSPYLAPANRADAHLNIAAYAAPATGQWGSAGRNSIIGPSQFTLTSSLGRSFKVRDKWMFDFRADSSNLVNHVSFTGWNTVVNGTTFGLPASANAMRTIQITGRLRY